MAVALACAGAQVFLTGRRREKLEETRGEVHELGGNADRCVSVPADITREDEVEAACLTIRDNCSTLHGLVNNAAVPQHRESPWPLQENSLESWERMLRLNVTAPWLVSRAILPHMIDGGEVRIVFITSEAGWAFTPGVGQYNISKAALNNLGASLAHECAARYPQADVQINMLNPGEARTEMNQGSQRSPYAVVPMILQLLSHPAGGPDARFFHADGRHLSFTYSDAYQRPLSEVSEEAAAPAAIPFSPPHAPSPLPWWRRLISNKAS
jgi:NAD(P)-dependent dehydrogenase (short-subunit alcohol dehydrogenase family)